MIGVLTLCCIWMSFMSLVLITWKDTHITKTVSAGDNITASECSVAYRMRFILVTY